MLRILWLSACLLTAATLGSNPARAAGGLEEVRDCVEANLPAKSSKETIRMIRTDRTGSKSTLNAVHYWQFDARGRSKNLIEVEGPPDVRGSAYLVIQKGEKQDIFSYLPEIGRPRRVNSSAMSGSIFGTDFSFEDIQYFQDTANQTNTKRLEDGDLDGRGIFRLETLPPPEEKSAYQRVVTMIDRETCVPLRIEYFGEDDELMKVLATDPASIEKKGNGWVATSLTLKNLKNETQTVILIDEVELDPKLKERLFTVTYLEKKN
jgi:hypothetical protein